MAAVMKGEQVLDKQESVEKKLADLERNFTALHTEVAKIRGDMTRSSKQVNRHSALLKLVDEHKATKTLDQINNRVDELASMLQVEILKQTVCSEVSRHYPEVWPMVVRALDRPNDWWTDGDALTVKDWRDRLVKAFRSTGDATH